MDDVLPGTIMQGVSSQLSIFALFHRSCDRLRCTSCDFQVVYFNDQEWNSKCDYLFFRNNMPNVRKLRQNLVKKRGEEIVGDI